MRELVFISYSHADEKYLTELLTHLKTLERADKITKWSDQQIAPGSQWLADIQAALAQTKIVVMLVSPAFLASDFIHEHELTPMLQAAKTDSVRIFWIPVRACLYEETPLNDFQAVLPPNQPLAGMKQAERDEAWVKVCKAIKQALNPLTTNPNPAHSGPAHSAPINQTTAHPALTVWREKLDFLQTQEAITSDPAQQFQLKKLIAEAEQKIQSLGG
jgi:hypothetical protein